MAKMVVQVTREQKVSEISDYLTANPACKAKEVLSHFATKWKVSTRTIQRFMSEATELKQRRDLQDEALRAQARRIATLEAQAEATVRSRDEVAKKLWSVIEMHPKAILNDDGEVIKVIVPTFSDQVRAAAQYCKIYGYDAPTKVEGQLDIFQAIGDLTDEELEKLYNGK